MRSPFPGVDVVDEGKDVAVIILGVLHRNFDFDVVRHATDVDDAAVNRGFASVQIGNIFTYASFIIEGEVFWFLRIPQISQGDFQSPVQKCALLEMDAQNLEVESLRFRKNQRIGLESDFGSDLFSNADF